LFGKAAFEVSTPCQRKEGRVYIGGGLLALIVIILILIWLF